jgi:hypothetical protein
MTLVCFDLYVCIRTLWQHQHRYCSTSYSNEPTLVGLHAVPVRTSGGTLRGLDPARQVSSGIVQVRPAPDSPCAAAAAAAAFRPLGLQFGLAHLLQLQRVQLLRH